MSLAQVSRRFPYLLPRFYDIDQGEILLDGHSIKTYKISDLRKLIGVVSQDIILFHDTIYNNIAFEATSGL